MSSIHSIRQSSAGTVECSLDGSLDELAACALYSTVAVRDPGKSGLVGTLPRPVRFRVGVDDPVRRREMIDATEQRFGWVNRPGDWDVNLVPSGDGWIAEFGPLSWTRRFGCPERLPWSTNLVVAEVLVRLAKIQPGQHVVDPFCGTGTILLAVRRRTPTARATGIDHNPHALHIAAANTLRSASNKVLGVASDGALGVAPDNALGTAADRVLGVAAGNALGAASDDALGVSADRALPGGGIELVRGAAEALPLAGGSVDRVVANLPFGKQVGSHRANRTLYPAVLDEIDRVLAGDGRAVLLTEDKRLLHSAIERNGRLKIVRQRLLRYNGATPTAYVLARTRLPRTAMPR
jgi:tRNA (guanine6-N2)-methyltransferase